MLLLLTKIQKIKVATETDEKNAAKRIFTDELNFIYDKKLDFPLENFEIFGK